MNKPPSDHATLRKFLQMPQVQEQVAGIIPKHLTPERVTGLMLSATLRNPKLLRCSMMSITQAMIQVAELGLEPSPAFGHLYLIPYENRKLGITECQVQVAYGGLAQLVYNSGFVASLDTVPVFHGDPFAYIEGSDPHITHEVSLDADRSEDGLRAVYCRVTLTTGAKKFDLMTRKEIDRIRSRSKSANDGPWVTDYVEMAKKSVLRRITKQLPKSAEAQHLARALESDAEEAAAPQLPAGRSIVSMPFSVTAPPAEAEAPAAAQGPADEVPDENGVLPDLPPAPPENAEPADKLIFALRAAPDADAVRALKPEVEAFRGTPRQNDVGTAFAEAVKRVKS